MFLIYNHYLYLNLLLFTNDAMLLYNNVYLLYYILLQLYTLQRNKYFYILIFILIPKKPVSTKHA